MNGKDIKFDEVDSYDETIDLEFEELQAAKASEVHVQRLYAPDSMRESVPLEMESYRDFILKSLMTSYDSKMMKKWPRNQWRNYSMFSSQHLVWFHKL